MSKRCTQAFLECCQLVMQWATYHLDCKALA